MFIQNSYIVIQNYIFSSNKYRFSTENIYVHDMYSYPQTQQYIRHLLKLKGCSGNQDIKLNGNKTLIKKIHYCIATKFISYQTNQSGIKSIPLLTLAGTNDNHYEVFQHPCRHRRSPSAQRGTYYQNATGPKIVPQQCSKVGSSQQN